MYTLVEVVFVRSDAFGLGNCYANNTFIVYEVDSRGFIFPSVFPDLNFVAFYVKRLIIFNCTICLL